MLKNFFIVVLSFSLISSNFVLSVRADQTENSNSVTSFALTDSDFLDLVYDENIDLQQSYDEKGLMNLDVSRMLSETDEDYCSRFEQVAKEQTSFAVAIPNECLQYFESSNNLLPVSYFYDVGEPVPYFVSTAFLATGAVIALGGLLAATYYYSNSNSFVNSVYGTFNKLADNAKTNLSNLFSNNSAYNNVDTDFISDIHGSFTMHTGKFANILGYKYNTYYPMFNNFATISNVSVDSNKCTFNASVSTTLNSKPEFEYKGDSFYLSVGLRNNVNDGVRYSYSFADSIAAEKGCSIMNFGLIFTNSYRGYGADDVNSLIFSSIVLRKNDGYITIPQSSGGFLSTSWRAYDDYGSFYSALSDFWKDSPILNVDDVDFYKNGSVTIGRFPENLLDYAQTDAKTGALTGVYTPPLTNTQTGEKVDTIVPTTPPPTTGGGGTVPPPVLPEEDFDGWVFNIDFSPLFEVGEKFLNVFPFSLIRDFTQVLENFDAEPKTPIFEIPIFDGNSVTLDLSFGNGWASFFRSTFNFVYSGLLAYYLFKRISL
ncbi:MAG: hypothetical protein ACRDD4_13220 [Culicoidibacterales bacterium]